jgi:hypothetical protein
MDDKPPTQLDARDMSQNAVWDNFRAPDYPGLGRSYPTYRRMEDHAAENCSIR